MLETTPNVCRLAVAADDIETNTGKFPPWWIALAAITPSSHLFGPFTLSTGRIARRKHRVGAGIGSRPGPGSAPTPSHKRDDRPVDTEQDTRVHRCVAWLVCTHS